MAEGRASKAATAQAKSSRKVERLKEELEGAPKKSEQRALVAASAEDAVKEELARHPLGSSAEGVRGVGQSDKLLLPVGALLGEDDLDLDLDEVFQAENLDGTRKEESDELERAAGVRGLSQGGRAGSLRSSGGQAQEEEGTRAGVAGQAREEAPSRPNQSNRSHQLQLQHQQWPKPKAELRKGAGARSPAHWSQERPPTAEAPPPTSPAWRTEEKAPAEAALSARAEAQKAKAAAASKGTARGG